MMSLVRTILLVEDNPQKEMLILRALRKVNLAKQVDPTILPNSQQRWRTRASTG
jgi:hypothetical protein